MIIAITDNHGNDEYQSIYKYIYLSIYLSINYFFYHHTFHKISLKHLRIKNLILENYMKNCKRVLIKTMKQMPIKRGYH